MLRDRLTAMAMSDVTINEVLESMTARGGKLVDGAAALEKDLSRVRFSVAVMGDDTAQSAITRRDRLRLSVERDTRMDNTIFRFYAAGNAGQPQRDQARDAITSFVADAMESEVNIRRQRLDDDHADSASDTTIADMTEHSKTSCNCDELKILQDKWNSICQGPSSGCMANAKVRSELIANFKAAVKESVAIYMPKR